jgi:two-component system, LytTR family, response regulator LytT
MIFNCVIIDDEPLAIDVITEHIERTPSLNLAQKFTHSVKAFEYLSENKTDIIFVDIQMPDLTGIELVKKLEYKPAIIFTTAFDKYAVEGFRVDAIDYLLKPVDYPDFLKAIEKAKKWIISTYQVLDLKLDKQFLFIKSEHKLTRIELSSIKYIEGMSEYVRIHRENAKPIMSLLNLKSLERKLPENLFMRVHKSYIINLSKITEIENNIIICTDGKMIPVSKMYKQNFQDYIGKNFML